MLSNLQNDVRCSIIERLPLKSIVRAKILNREWRNFINSSDFINSHLKNSPKDLRAILCLTTFSSIYLVHDLDTLTFRPTKLTLPPAFRRNRVHLVGSCNGLLCVQDRLSRSHFLIINPAQPGSYEMVRSPIKDLRNDFEWNSCLSYRFSKFFYDEKRDDYMILYKFQSSYSRTNEIDESIVDKVYEEDGLMIYSTNSGSWKTLKNLPKNEIGRDNSYSLLNNRLHFVSKNREYLQSYDLYTEEWNVVHLPSVEESYNVANTFIFDKRLGVKMDVEGCNRQELWVMKEYGVRDSWTKLLSFERTFVTLLFYSEMRQQFLLYNAKLGLFWYSEREEKIKDGIKIEGLDHTFSETEVIIGSLVPIGNDENEAARSPKRLKMSSN